jgi:hypothetical protein
MANWFEDLTKTVSDDKLTRRQAVGRIATVVAGATIAAWLPDQALAKHIPWKKQCPNGGCGCTCGFTNCTGNPNVNCYCFLDINGKGACGCNSYCSQLKTCTQSSHCPRDTFCAIENGCDSCGTSSGVCLPKCKGKYKNCQLGGTHSGPTAAR